MSILLQQLQDAFKASTPGPWEGSPVGQASSHSAVIYAPAGISGQKVDIVEASTDVDARFICLAKNSMPVLLRAAKFVNDFWEQQAPYQVSGMADENSRTLLDDLGDTARAIIKELSTVENEDDVATSKLVKVSWNHEGDNDGFIFGIEHIQDSDVLHVEWFKSRAMRDKAYELYEADETTTIREEWHGIGSGLTRVFSDELNGCSWFILNGELMWSPVSNAQKNGIYTEEIADPDALPDWYRIFLLNLLKDKSYQRNYKEGVFYDVLTDWLLIDKEYVTEYKPHVEEDKVKVEISGNGFVFNGVNIENPTLSTCGRFQVDPQLAYGFEIYHTGGGCTALQLETKDGGYVWLTDNDLSHEIPTEPGADFVMGFYNEEGDELAIFNLKVGIPPEYDNS